MSVQTTKRWRNYRCDDCKRRHSLDASAHDLPADWSGGRRLDWVTAGPGFGGSYHLCGVCAAGCGGVAPTRLSVAAFHHPWGTFTCAGCLTGGEVLFAFGRPRLPKGWRAVPRPDGPPRAICPSCLTTATSARTP